MKPGTPIQGLDVQKNAENIVVQEREKYDDFINNLCTPLTTLAQLRKMPVEEASQNDMKRYLKLTRRLEIKAKNADAGIQK